MRVIRGAGVIYCRRELRDDAAAVAARGAEEALPGAARGAGEALEILTIRRSRAGALERLHGGLRGRYPTTAVPHAPWFVIPADHKWFTRLAVVAAIDEALRRLDLHYPTIRPSRWRRLRRRGGSSRVSRQPRWPPRPEPFGLLPGQLEQNRDAEAAGPVAPTTAFFLRSAAPGPGGRAAAMGGELLGQAAYGVSRCETCSCSR